MRFFFTNGTLSFGSPFNSSPTSWHRPGVATTTRTNQKLWNFRVESVVYFGDLIDYIVHNFTLEFKVYSTIDFLI